MKSRKKGNGDGSRSVKVSKGTYSKLQTLVTKVAREGWDSLGMKRTDRPSMGAAVDAAVDRLLVKS